ncbi:MAG: DctP family TRAP transporter solute-binding subunit [Arenicella sp.]
MKLINSLNPWTCSKSKSHHFMKSSLLIVLFFLVFFAVNTVNAEPIKIRFSHTVDEDTPKGKMANRFKQLVSERLGNDKVVVEVYPNSTLFDDNGSVDELLKNTVEMAAPAMSILKKYTTRLQVMDLPFLFVTPEAASNFLRGAYGDRLLRLVEPQGLLGLGFLDNGMKQLSMNSSLKVPTDVKGKRFRIMNSDVLESQFKQVGATPLKKSFKHVYSLLEDNEVDGQENTWSNIYSKKFFEHQPFIVESNHGYLGYMIVTNKVFWEGIPSDVRIILDKALAEAIDYGNKVALEKSIADKNKILASGKSEIHTMSLEERKAWVEVMKPVWNLYKDEIGSELILAAASAR